MRKNQQRKIVISIPVLMVCTWANFALAAPLLSQYIDGSADRKGIEIYNPDATPVNLSEYQIVQYNNGKTTPQLTVKLSGQLSSKSKFLIGHSALKSALGDQVNFSANFSFNGDDVIVLMHNGVAIDRFGQLGVQPANGWGGIAKANSFKRTALTNNVSAQGIDINTPFDLSSWEKWSDRNAFSTYLNSTNTTPPDETISNINCNTADQPIANLSTVSIGQNVVIRGVITADYRYENGFSGFYLQTPDNKAIADKTNAVFVYLPPNSQIKGGKQGEEVILSGRLNEFKQQRQIEPASTIVTCNTNASTLINPIAVTLPFQSLDLATGNSPKRYQGMLVKIPQKLTVSETYNLGRYGQISLSLGRLYIPTNLFPANSAEAKNLANQNKLSKIELDDGYNSQNRTPTIPYNFSAVNTLRSGNQISDVEGILEYRFDSWRIQPIQGRTQPKLDTATNPRPTVIPKDSKLIRAAAFNVLNYDNGLEKGFPTERGATSKATFDKQHAKIVSALKAIDADVYGLMEIANNGYSDKSAVANLTQALGSQWKYVTPPNLSKLGSDVIAVAIIYNSSRVKPINSAVVYDDLSQKNRVTMAQSFQALSGGKIFTVIPNHLKSKGSCPTNQSLDADQADGQGCWNATRVKAVDGLLQWVAKNPTGLTGSSNTLLLGDFNSYSKEDPMLQLEKANYKNLLADQKIGLGEKAYSYVFGVDSNKEGYGGAGNLDHAIADPQLYPLVKKAFVWHINADEPTNLDYNDKFKTPEQQALFYQADAFRSSDHDPVIVDLALSDNAESQNNNNPPSRSGGGAFDLWSVLGLSIFSSVIYMRRRKKIS